MPIVVQKKRDKPDKQARFLLLFALAIIVFVMVALQCNPLVLFSFPSSTSYTPEPTLTPEENAYLACAKFSYEPYYYPNGYSNSPVFIDSKSWSPVVYPLPKPAAIALGDNRYKVDLYVNYNLVIIEKSPISGKDVVTYKPSHGVYECIARYRGTENDIEYWDVEILGRKAE